MMMANVAATGDAAQITASLSVGRISIKEPSVFPPETAVVDTSRSRKGRRTIRLSV